MPVKLRVRRLKAELRSGEQVTIPGWIADSGKPGPVLLLTAAQHGNEIQGAEVIRRFMELAETRLRCGKVFAVPFANPSALRDRRPHIRMKPEQPYVDNRGHNMNLLWPGKRAGNNTARIPHAIYQAFGEEATHVLDLHCWEKNHAPAVLVPNDPAHRELALKLGQRFVVARSFPANILGGLFATTERIGVTYEFAGQYVVSEAQVKRGMVLATNMAKAIGMVAGPLAKGEAPVLFVDECDIIDVTAPCSGLFVEAGHGVCAYVEKGDRLGHILSDVSLKTREVHAPRAGYLKGYGASRPNCDVSITGHHPYVTRGERLAIVVSPKT